MQIPENSEDRTGEIVLPGDPATPESTFVPLLPFGPGGVCRLPPRRTQQHIEHDTTPELCTRRASQ